MMNNPYQSYGNTSVMTATPGELTLMLYNGGIRFLKQAKQAMEQKNIEQTNNNILKGQNIILELMSTLNMEIEISKNLMALYDFMHRHLIEANIKKNVKMVDEVIALLEEMRDTWTQVMKLSRPTATQHG